MNTLLFILLVLFSNQPKISINKSFTVESLGACQGVASLNRKVYLYGDREVGIIREFYFIEDSLAFTGQELQLTNGGKNIIKHPTGIAYADGKAFIGNSVRSKEDTNKWIAEIFFIDWNRLLKDKVLDNSIINRVEDDLAIQGTRPEYIEYNNTQYVATADYGSSRNEVRLYNPKLLSKASKTSDKDVLVYKFTCTPWVQNLHWIKDKNILVLVQNQIEGRQWRLSFLDLPASIASGKAEVIKVVDFDKVDELEGFCLINGISKGIATTSSRKSNIHIMSLNC
ncbi:hypothetical protein [Dysgonomonas sp.]